MMARTITEFSVFIASPSDVSHERDVVAATISEWNSRYGRDRGLVFNILRWESSVSAGFGFDGQDVINNQIGEDYDLLIGLFWARFGSPTARASSGTSEEYHRALSRFKKGEKIEIALLFKDTPVDFRSIDLSQIDSLRSFEKEAQGAGALTKMFKDDDGLRLEVGLILDNIARSHYNRDVPKKIPNSAGMVGLSASDSLVTNSNNGDDDEDIGIFDVVERLEIHAAAAGAFLVDLTSALQAISDTTKEVSSYFSETRDVRPLTLDDTKPGIARVSDSMDSFSALLESDLSSYAENLIAVGDDARDMIRVSYDWIDTEEEMLDNLSLIRNMLGTIHAGITSNQVGMEDMLSTVSKLPRTTTSFNKSKRRFIANARSLIDANDRGKAILVLALDELGRLTFAVEQRAKE